MARKKYYLPVPFISSSFNDHPGYGDLFNLQEKPYQLNNLWDSNPELRLEKYKTSLDR